MNPHAGRPTGRELQILALIAQGDTAPLAASRLGISTYTVKTHLARARARMGARNTSHAVALSYEYGWLTKEDVDETVPARIAPVRRAVDARGGAGVTATRPTGPGPV